MTMKLDLAARTKILVRRDRLRTIASELEDMAAMMASMTDELDAEADDGDEESWCIIFRNVANEIEDAFGRARDAADFIDESLNNATHI